MPRRPHIPPKDFPRPPTREYAGTRADAARWVRDVLRGQILEGAFGGLAAARPALPSESALAAELGVSRNAIREALKLLRAEGLITRVQGSGTFVTGAKLRQHLDRLEGLAESLAGHRIPVENRVLSVRESTATPFVAAKLQLPENAPILFIERLRSVGGVPLSLDTTSLRAGAIPLDANFDSDDVFTIIETKLGVRLGWAEITVESVLADATTSELLRVRPGAPLLLLHRLTHLEDGTPFDLETVRYRGDRCSLVTTTPRDQPP
ncbi:GntR family transcriptional regulator [Mycobacterium saskatchewanense]|uniref:GntR family transcriptional regulator n=1 Tax=Mycobacterium saskatchewanense TaxID=220927 RepID=A0AAJ3NM60_9MYCO|nr:GntR family transcriptional regulator [Mycobacterium saskatchewanense]ORW67824.1 GntR family transcriptional regulator [Mycobacterium saskatchewanense]BBX60927.1 GntR family transcriptional regulator [Mycobacterium saskatchewanense]